MSVKFILLLNICIAFGETSVTDGLLKEPLDRTDSYVNNNCPKDWERFGQEKCFRLFGGTKYTWAEAQGICRQHDSHLASVHSKEELDFLNSYFLREYSTDKILADSWIGGFKTGIFWSWLDLSPFDFTDWFPGFPEDQVQCIYLTTEPSFLNTSTQFGKMANYDSCNLKLNFICQKYQADARRHV